MHDRDMPQELMRLILSILRPAPEPSPLGGRPPIPHEVVLQVLWFVMKTGIPWRMVPKAMGCSGETVRTRILLWAKLKIWSRVHKMILKALNAAGELDLDTMVVDSTLVRAHGGGADTGPNPTDRRKLGTKYTLMVDGRGVPLQINSAPANRSDQRELLPIVASFQPIGGRPGSPRTKAKEIYADAGYDNESTRHLLRWLGITPWIRKKGTEHGSGLGKVRYVVERTIAWLKGIPRFRFRSDRSQAMIDSVKRITMIFVCYRILARNN